MINLQKVWEWAGIELATPVSAVRHVTDCAMQLSRKSDTSARHSKINHLTEFNPLSTGNPSKDTFTNSEDPDEMLLNVAFHQGLHCLLR